MTISSKLSVLYLQTGENTRTVHHFACIDWDDESDVPRSLEQLVALVVEVNKAACSGRPIILLCRFVLTEKLYLSDFILVIF